MPIRVRPRSSIAAAVMSALPGVVRAQLRVPMVADAAAIYRSRYGAMRVQMLRPGSQDEIANVPDLNVLP
jgi:hypothetical protein